MSLRDLFLALTVVIVWGVNFTVIKLGLNGMPPMLLGCFRFLLVAFPAVLIISPPAVPLRWIIAYGLTAGVGQFGFLFYAIEQGMPAGLASVVLQSQAIFTLLFASLFLHERWFISQLFGLIIASSGLIVIGCSRVDPALYKTLGETHMIGFTLTLCGAAFWGLSNILVRSAWKQANTHGKQFNMFRFIIWSSLVPPIPFLLLSLSLEGSETIIDSLQNFNIFSFGSIAYLAFGATLLGFGIWSSLLSRYPAGHIAPFSLLVPIFGLLTASLVLGEQLTVQQWQGCALVMAGLLIIIFGNRVLGFRSFRRKLSKTEILKP
ncbi:EamA family transporter [Methylobacter sp. YRD-M1]|uniref:EamA family transporter n=1 Tax=Methylobacter sp. YRD-M1 TaxID=2911520 RepID=UPI001894CC4A|nr:EamA family transporter [Methylobacter sp. YRD-M1]MBF6651099.1 EamA family transporter [Methylobacter sp. BlB1]WAK04548.1 EamA family transporter [Methylobacter sp. YRD-M1]